MQEIKVKYSENRRPTDTTDRITYPTSAVSKNEKRFRHIRRLVHHYYLVSLWSVHKCALSFTKFHRNVKIPLECANSTAWLEVLQSTVINIDVIYNN